MSKQILVTGGAGYIGSALVPQLLKEGYHVRVLDTLVYGDFGLDDVKKDIELIQGNVLDAHDSVMKDIFGVIHLAGLSTEPMSAANPRMTDRINHIGTEHIAKLAKKNDVERFVFASSCSIYFTYTTGLKPDIFTEDTPLNPISPYSLSKASAEEALKELTDASFQPTVLRKGTIYGYAPKMRYDLVLNSFTKDAFRERKINVHTNGDIYRPLLDIEDAVLAYSSALTLPLEKVGGKTFNAVHGNWNIGELAKEFKAALKRAKNIDIEINVEPVDIARNYLADEARFKEVFQTQASRPIEAAILEMWDKLEAGHDYRDARFYTDQWHKQKRAA